MNRRLVLAMALLMGLVPGAYAQIATGNVYGNVTDQSGAVLPGAAVALASDFGNRSTTSGSQGDFRFLNLDAGRYKITVSLAGFTTVNREVTVVTGENVNVGFGLKVATVEETLTVTAEAPLVDPKKRGTSTTMTAEELKGVPNARDPWGVLARIPGVLVDRVNIAGNENGQQAAVAGKGSTTGDKVWNIDGLNITDMSATGASPAYFDFDAFQEFNVTTGGNDLTMQTGGIGLNLVTKRGTNKFHGGGRYMLANHELQSGNVPDNIASDPRLLGSDRANSIDQISDYGFDLGGAIVKDKLWFWGSYGKQDIRLQNYVQTKDKTLLAGYNGKLNWQATANTMVSAFYFRGGKEKFGRSPGSATGFEADSFLVNQIDVGTDGGLPQGLWKAEINHTFSPNFFVSAKAAYYDTGFGLIARGGPDQSYTLDYAGGQSIGSYSNYKAVRPQKTLNLDGNYFFAGMGGNNELKFGFGYRSVTTNSVTSYNGNALVGIINSATDESQNYAQVARNGVVNYGGKYASGYIGDVFTKNRFALNLGVRYDHQTAKNLASDAPANVTFPNVLPALSYAGSSENVIEWNDISPRLGFSYALNESRKTVLRTSYARYASQLSYGNATDENPVAYGILAYGWSDLNHDRFVQPNEVHLNDFQYNINVDPAHPAAVGNTVNKIDRDYKAKHDSEVIVGLDHELAANFAVGAAYTWRKGDDWAYRPRIGGDCGSTPTFGGCHILGPSDYIQNAPTTANGFSAFTYSPNATLVTAGGGGRLRTNRPDYSTTFSGVEMTLTKRLSNKWMGRVAFSFNDWTESFDGTPVGGNTATGSSAGNPTRTDQDPLVDGGQVAALSGGSGKASFYTSIKWQLFATGLVQLPASFDLSASVFGRQGGPYPVSLRLGAGRDATLQALAAPEVDSTRLNTLWNLDLRLAKNIKFGGSAITLSAELFNAFNNNLVLSRFRFANSSSFTSTVAGAEPGLGRVEEIVSPRILRVGARFSF
jgi:Carboxypeptidase regulatory-like domain/TonB-dependent Receptor Plug Domain